MVTRTLASLGAALVMVLLVAVGVRADAPATAYYACVNNNSGTIHMVSAGSTCSTGEQLVTWNQTGPQGATGSQGPTGPVGPQGPQGPQGPAGANGVSGYRVVSKTIQLLGGPDYHEAISADCPSGERAVGGGYSVPASTVFAPNLPLTVYSTAPMGSDGVVGDGWTLSFDAAVGAGYNSSLTVYAICTTAS